MPSVAIDDNKRMHLRVSPEAKAKLMRAAAIQNTDLTEVPLAF
ncbi:type II toxin -antitoxin system TacA 1-like antitoxin [Asticcacaulis aquaticus]